MGNHHNFKVGDKVKFHHAYAPKGAMRLRGVVKHTNPKTPEFVHIEWKNHKNPNKDWDMIHHSNLLKEGMKTQEIVKAASKKDGLSLKKLVHEVLATKVVAALDAERRVVAAQYFGEENVEEAVGKDHEYGKKHHDPRHHGVLHKKGF